MVSEYTSMLLQMPDCNIPQSPDAGMAEHLSHTVGFLASPAQFAAVSEEPFRTGSGAAQMHAPGAHTENRDAASKACSKCKMTKPLAGFFKDKSKPDGLYSQCKECATSEERRRREERAPLAAEHAKQAKRCTRCRMQKDVEQFCRNSRSFDGRYSQCRTCVANKDKSRRQRLVERRDDPVEAKLCSRCNIDKHNSEYYRDSSKPDGLQTYCKQCLCDKNKTTRKKKHKSGRDNLAGGVAFAHVPVSEVAADQPMYQPGEQLGEDMNTSAAMAEPGSRSLSPSQMHCGYSLQGEATEGHDGYGADAGFSAAPQQDYSLQTRGQQQPGPTEEQPGGEDLGEKCVGAYLHTPADNSSPGRGCSFNQDQGVSQFINSPDYPAPLAGPFDIAHGYPVQQGHEGRHAQAHHPEQHQSSSAQHAAFPQQDGFHEQEAFQTEMQYIPSGYDMAEDAAQQDKHAEANEPLGYLNSEIQEHRSRLAATMLV